YFSLRPADRGDDTVALDEGLVIAVCDGDCPTSGENSEREILALFVPWGAGEEESIIELPGFKSSGYKNMFVPVPGAVVAYQLTAGSEVYDELVGLGRGIHWFSGPIPGSTCSLSKGTGRAGRWVS